MKTLSYRIRLRQPTLVTAPGGDPNTDESLDYLPGSVLRGALIQRYCQQQGPIDVADAVIRRLFFSSETRFLNGYIAYHDKPAYPVPHSLMHHKSEEYDVFDFALEPQTLVAEDPWKSLQGKYAAFLNEDDGENMLTVSVNHEMSVHTQRDRVKGRAMAYSGAVYRYRALAPDQSFIATIVCDHDKDAEILKAHINGFHFLGGARTSGYGKVECTLLDDVDPDSFDLPSQRLTILFASDAILRDPHTGQYSSDTDVYAQAISAKIGLAKIDAFTSPCLVSGFNRTWGLPLPQTIGLVKGSTLVFEIPNGMSREHKKNLKQQCQELEQAGIGERRSEGFGQLRLHRYEVEQWSKDNYTQNYVINDTLEKLSKLNQPNRQNTLAMKMGQEISIRLFRKRLDDTLLDKVGNIRIKYAPSNAQLSELRTVIRNAQLQTPPDLQQIQDYLAKIEKRRQSSEQFSKAWIGHTSLLDWLTEKASAGNTDSVKSLLGLQDADLLTETLSQEYTLKYIDFVLASAIKTDKEAHHV